MYACNESLCDIDCEGSTNCECFRCGLPVCKTCSYRMPYLHFGTRRICRSCRLEMKGETKRLRKQVKRLKREVAELIKDQRPCQ